jgi:hypothetical protein
VPHSAQPSTQCRITINGGEVAKQLTGSCEQNGMPMKDSLMGNILSESGFSEATGANQDVVGSGLQEIQA